MDEKAITYVALLRGINVGGKNLLPMAELKLSFERAGMEDVITYINTGNIIFSSSRGKRTGIITKLERAIQEDFGLTINVLLRTYEEFRDLIHFLPAEWRNDSKNKCDVMFLWQDIDGPTVLQELNITASGKNNGLHVEAHDRNKNRIKPNKKPEQVHYFPGAVIWYVDRTKTDKCHALQKLASNKNYRKMTVRNINTVRKVYDLMSEIANKPACVY